MSPEKRKELAAWLNETFDSHAVYDAAKLADLEQFGLIVTPEKNAVLITDPETSKSCRIGSQSYAQVKKAIEARGLGGWLEPTENRLVTGHVVSRAIATLFTDEPGGDRFMGRGFAHRANLASIAGTSKLDYP